MFVIIVSTVYQGCDLEKKTLQILKTLKTFEIQGAWFVQSKVKITQG